jgi:hypothetical protein
MRNSLIFAAIAEKYREASEKHGELSTLFAALARNESSEPADDGMSSAAEILSTVLDAAPETTQPTYGAEYQRTLARASAEYNAEAPPAAGDTSGLDAIAGDRGGQIKRACDFAEIPACMFMEWLSLKYSVTTLDDLEPSRKNQILLMLRTEPEVRYRIEATIEALKAKEGVEYLAPAQTEQPAAAEA